MYVASYVIIALHNNIASFIHMFTIVLVMIGIYTHSHRGFKTGSG